MNVKEISEIAELFNYVEIGLWSMFGLAMLLKSRDVKGYFKKLSYISATAFFVFAFSDYIEIQTGAWWRPWWLFVLKASCVVTFAYCLLQYFRAKSKKSI